MNKPETSNRIKKVSVFGGALPQPGDPAYKFAYQLGQELARSGFAVLNGGYIGTMEAVSRGCFEAGGHVIGVTCQEIENWRPVKPNAWISEERRFCTLQERLNTLLQECDAAIALPGGIGTLTEVALLWNQIAINSRSALPIILIGTGWKTIFETFFVQLGEYIPEKERARLQFVNTSTEAVKRLQSQLAN